MLGDPRQSLVWKNHVERLKGAKGWLARHRINVDGVLGHLEIKTARFPNCYTQLTNQPYPTGQPYPTDQPNHQKMAIWASCGPEAGPLWSRYGFVRGPPWNFLMQKTPSLGEVKSIKNSRIFFPYQNKGAVFSLALRYPIWIYPMRYLWDIIGVCTNQTRQFMFHLYTMRSLCFPSKNGGTPVEGVVLFLEWPSQAPSAIEATTRTAAFGTETKFLGETKLEDVRPPDQNLDEKIAEYS